MSFCICGLTVSGTGALRIVAVPGAPVWAKVEVTATVAPTRPTANAIAAMNGEAAELHVMCSSRFMECGRPAPPFLFGALSGYR
jgi:hypothetical protein